MLIYYEYNLNIFDNVSSRWDNFGESYFSRVKSYHILILHHFCHSHKCDFRISE